MRVSRSQGFPLRLRPGAPACLELLPGHPFSGGSAVGGATAGAGVQGGSQQPAAAGGAGPGDSDVVQPTPLEAAAADTAAAAAAAAEKTAGGGAGAAKADGGDRSSGVPCAAVTSCEALPDFTVRALDAWGNVTAPAPELPFEVVAASSGLEPGQDAFRVDDRCAAQGRGPACCAAALLQRAARMNVACRRAELSLR